MTCADNRSLSQTIFDNMHPRRLRFCDSFVTPQREARGDTERDYLVINDFQILGVALGVRSPVVVKLVTRILLRSLYLFFF